MSPPSLRRPALDGLRGLAALVVVVHHAMLLSPHLGYFGRGQQVDLGSWSWWLTFTPVHLVWAGEEAVFVFFVLSGLVLALPAASGKPIQWRSYYAQRLTRLYVPAITATALSVVLIALVPRHPPATASHWLGFHTSPASMEDVLTTAMLVRGPTGINSALWSLKWEVTFSLLLPVFVVLLIRVQRLVWLRLTALVVLIALSSPMDHLYFLYLPIFGLGVVMAQNLAWLDRAGSALTALRPVARRAIAAGIALLLMTRWWVPSSWGTSPWLVKVELLGTLLGACLLVWIFASTDIGRRIGTQRNIAWLGKRSFSLYLVHEPIVVTVAYLFGGTTNAALVLVIALPVSLLTAEVFGRLVETPSHRLAKRVGGLLRKKAPAGSGDTPSGVALTPLVAASS